VTLNVPLSTLRATDEFPYQAAIAAGVKLVMVSWAVYPALGTRRPGGLSTNVVNGELRTRLGFTGVTITDALEAGALAAYGTTQNRATQAAGAGMDLILCASGSVSQGITAMDGMRTAYNDGTLPHAAFQAAVSRVVALRQSLPA
jgi:beta-N-acetylhexosaminidase